MSALAGRVAVVTGATRGLGAEIARALAARGAQTVLIGRAVDRLEALDDAITEAGGLKPTLVPFDLREHDRIASLGPSILERHGRCDMLIANAAMLGGLTPVHQQQPANWDRVIDVNLTANQRLLATLDPLLRASDKGQVLFITSRLGTDAVPFWGAYAVSKAGLNMLGRLYAAENKAAGIRVTLHDPGIMATGMRAEAFPGEDPSGLTTAEAAARKILDLLSN